MKFETENKVLVAGHRGNPSEFPENTMASFQSAVEVGVDMIETDIHLTKDGVLVLIHDHDVNRTTDGIGLVREKTYEEIKKLNAGTEEMPSPIPTLSEFLEYCASVPGLLLDLEIKVYLNDEGAERVEYAVDETIKMCENIGLGDRIILNSFDAYVLEYIYKTYGKKYLIHGYYPYSLMENVKLDPTEYLDYACYWASGEDGKKKCDDILNLNINPCTGSNTQEKDFFEAVSFGCTMFTENNPACVIEWRKHL